MPVHRLLLPFGLALLTACAQQPANNVTLQPGERQSCSPVRLVVGQTLTLILPSNPTTGFRWQLHEAAPGVLGSLSPEVYSAPEDAGLVGGAGESTWRFQASAPGEGRLLLTYQRPWETDVPPARTVDCTVNVRQ
ncbi:protease inhibitor I42 family protein [Zestomonas thermotolerans]|uniref:protease inhibitor I42 family protein n=1 Tax=Zestomonas thermotolerans TaxID=157784 RepID=UPI00036F67E1|nr:protease inhibitor I42 family protein [Pseudomonas thermotolerans]MBO2509796.1 peptidase inhibitor I42 [Gammaproteobacteria bacterium]